MQAVHVTYFDRTSDDDPGPITEETLRIARRRGEELGIKHFVIASTRGFVARKARAELSGGITIFVGEARKSFDQDLLKELESKNIPVIFSHEAHYSYPSDVQVAYRRLSEGAKVCPEIVMIAADKDVVPIGKEVIAIAGTDSGADTAMVIVSAKSKNFRELKIRELICKPR